MPKEIVWMDCERKSWRGKAKPKRIRSGGTVASAFSKKGREKTLLIVVDN